MDFLFEFIAWLFPPSEPRFNPDGTQNPKYIPYPPPRPWTKQEQDDYDETFLMMDDDDDDD